MTKPEKKITLRDRKKAQPNALVYFSDAEKTTIAKTVANNLDDSQRNIFFYTCQALGLNPLLGEVCAVTYKGRMSIQVMRDGFLTIAHRSGKFAGLESGVKMTDDGKILYGWAKVYHADFQVPVYQEADFEEYNAPMRNQLWGSKPKTMIKKVAESMALRKAFNVSGVYAPEEMDKEIPVVTEQKKIEVKNGSSPATPEQIKTIQSMDKDFTVPEGFTKQQASDKLAELLS